MEKDFLGRYPRSSPIPTPTTEENTRLRAKRCCNSAAYRSRGAEHGMAIPGYSEATSFPVWEQIFVTRRFSVTRARYGPPRPIVRAVLSFRRRSRVRTSGIV